MPHFFFFASIAFQLSNMREENVLQIAALKDAIDSTNLGERENEGREKEREKEIERDRDR